MTQQFKFGDRVRRKNFPELNHQHFITVEFKTHSDGYPEITIISELGLVSKVPAECFELIPHPDTVRLDWLAKNDCALTENLGDEDGDRQDTPFAVIHVQEEHFEVLAAANNIRQAIDTAMQAQAAEAEAT